MSGHNHFSDCLCPWCCGGGGGYHGGGSNTIYAPTYSTYSPSERPWASWSRGHAKSDLREPLTYPTTCPICGAEIFFHTNGNGDVVFFDESLGPPWQKHECLTTEQGIRLASYEGSPLKKLADLGFRPPSIALPKGMAIRDYDKTFIGKEVTGVVVSCTRKTAWTPKAGSFKRDRTEVLSVGLYMSKKADTAIRVYCSPASKIKAGDVVRVTLEERVLDTRLVLWATQHEIIPPDVGGAW